jgi:MerR family transcriptional regulator, light-induced transcriptional regulator
LNSQHILQRKAHALNSVIFGSPCLRSEEVLALAQLSLQTQPDLLALIQSWQDRGCTLPHIYLEGITPAARQLGHWWLSDDIDFATVTMACSRLHRLLYELSPSFQADAAPALGATALLLAEPESQHTMGLFMLSEFFKRAGWFTLVEQPLMDIHLQRLLSGHWVDILALSISTQRQLPALKALVKQARAFSSNPRLTIIAGGPIVLQQPQCLSDLGVDWIGQDALETVQRATMMVDPLTLQN